MKTQVCIWMCLAAAAAAAAPAQTKTPVMLLQEALYAEETEGDLDKAIGLYEQVLDQAAQTEQLAARAAYQIGMCYLKQGSESQAAKYFQQLVRDYPKQQALTQRAQQQLEKLGVRVDAQVTEPVLSDSFEAGDGDAPAGWSRGAPVEGVQYVWDRAAGSDGSASLSLKKGVEKYFPIAQWTRPIEYTGGSKELKVSAKVRAKQAYKAVIDALFLDEKGEWIRHEWVSYIGAKEAGDQPAQHNWKEYAGTVDIPDNTKTIVIGLQMYGPGTVWFDDLKVAYVSDAEEMPQARQWVEDFFSNNFRDITSRKTLAWGEPTTDEEGNVSIRYTFEGRIWDKDTMVGDMIFTFDKDGKFLSRQDIVDTTTAEGLQRLVGKFFMNNYRDITARKTLEWGELTTNPDGTVSIRYKYEATIRDKDKIVNDEVFTFQPDGTYVSVEKISSVTPQAQAENFMAEGWDLFQQRKLAEAEAKFKEAARLDPANDGVWQGLGWAQLNQGKRLNAEESFKKCIELNPDNSACLNGLGWIAHAQNDKQQAIAWWEKAVKAQPDATAALSGLTQTCMEMQEYDKAVRYFVDWMELDNPQQPFEALQLVIKEGDKVVEPLIKEMKTSNNWQVPKALGAIGDKRAVDPLIEKWRQSNVSPMKEVIDEALELITGQHFETLEEWEKWRVSVQAADPS